MTAPRPFLVHGVYVPPPLASAVAGALGEAVARARRDGALIDDHVRELLVTLEHVAAEHHASVSGHGSEPGESTEAASEWISTDDAADQLGVTASRIRQMLRSGQLNGRQVGGRWLIERTTLEGEQDGAA